MTQWRGDFSAGRGAKACSTVPVGSFLQPLRGTARPPARERARLAASLVTLRNVASSLANSALMPVSIITPCDFADQLQATCPKGIDIYFENVGGAVQQTVWPLSE